MKRKLTVTIIQRHKSRGINTWYARIYDPETRAESYRSLHTEKKGEAMALAPLALQEEIEGREKKPTLDECFKKFIKQKEVENHPARTMYLYNMVRSTLAPIADKELEKITPEEITQILSEKYGNSTPGNYNTNRAYITIFLNWCHDHELTNKRIGKKIARKLTVKNKNPYFWTPDQVDYILDHAPNPQTRVTWALMAFAGLRREEAASVSFTDIFDGKLHVIGKGNKSATVPIGNRMQQELDRWGKELPHILSYSIWVKKAAVGIEFQGPATNHRFRHSFASNLIRAGVDVKSVQLLMRHEDIQITLNTYSHLLGSDLVNAINKI